MKIKYVRLDLVKELIKLDNIARAYIETVEKFEDRTFTVVDYMNNLRGKVNEDNFKILSYFVGKNFIIKTDEVGKYRLNLDYLY